MTAEVHGGRREVGRATHGAGGDDLPAGATRGPNYFLDVHGRLRGEGPEKVVRWTREPCRRAGRSEVRSFIHRDVIQGA